MRVLLTGGTGFLGSNLLARLLDLGHTVVLLKRSTSRLWRLEGRIGRFKTYDVDRDPLPRVFDENAVDIVVHCATNYGRKEDPPAEIVEANLMLPLRLLQAAQSAGVRCFINSDTILDKGVNHYSLSKGQFLDWFRLFAGRSTCVNVALENFYGPFDDRSKFVTSILLALMQGAPSIELTPGEQKRDFIYIDDVVDAYVRLIERGATFGVGFFPFEVASGSPITIREFVALAKELVGNRTTRLDFGARRYRDNEVMESRVDTSRIRELGWSAAVSLEEGLRRTIEQEKSRL